LGEGCQEDFQGARKKGGLFEKLALGMPVRETRRPGAGVVEVYKGPRKQGGLLRVGGGETGKK
jgi:hypothetical protein